MNFHVYRYDDGYVLELYPPLVGEETTLNGLTHDQARLHLEELDVDARDIIEMLDDADANYQRGHTDRSRGVADIWSRAKQGQATAEDVATLQAELAEATLEIRRTYLINALYMAGNETEALQRLVALIREETQSEDLQLALMFLHQWSPDAYAREALPFIRGSVVDNMGVRGWAMLYAGIALRSGSDPSLLDELVRILNDPNENDVMKGHARWAIANAAPDFDVAEFLHYSHEASAAEVNALIDRIRTHIAKPGRGG